MIVVDRPEVFPGHCIVNLSSEDPGGFIDTLTTPAVIDPRVYVSRQAVIDMGRAFGFAGPNEVDELRYLLSEAVARAEALQEENRTLTRDVEAAEWTLERKFQSKPQAKPGRPRKVNV